MKAVKRTVNELYESCCLRKLFVDLSMNLVRVRRTAAVAICLGCMCNSGEAERGGIVACSALLNRMLSWKRALLVHVYNLKALW